MPSLTATSEHRQPLHADNALAGQLACLGADDLELRFQPILLLRQPGKIALELLLRFRSPELARLGTQAVFQRAHDLDIAHQLDRLVLQQLEGVRRQWRALGPLAERVDYISVNISGTSVASPERLEALIALLRSLRVDPELFRLELTETSAMNLAEGCDSLRSASQRLMEELRLRLLVDDFGSGLSNYRRLCEAWYDAIKLDLQLVRGIAVSFRLQTFVGSLIDAVHRLGKTVVAEGVEHHRDLEALLRLGVDAVQGYLIARPMAWGELPAFLQASPWLARECIPRLEGRIMAADEALQAPLLRPSDGPPTPQPVPLERYVLEHWSSLSRFEDVLLRYVQELSGWGLQVMRFSLAFLPDREEVDCIQYIWFGHRPGAVETLRMQRDFLETPQHLQSVLHHIATHASRFHLPLAEAESLPYPFLEELRGRGGTDYFGLRLASRGVSIPVLTICLSGPRRFSAQEMERIETMSSLLSLLFHAFECERASRLALLDPLTQLPNRRSFDSRIRAEAVAAATTGLPLALLLVDIDRFKLVNDSLGHAYGDACLNRVASLLSQQLHRHNDMVCRLGGEEFGVILSNVQPEDAVAIAERLRQAVVGASIRHPQPVNGEGLTVSLGVASWSAQAGECLNVDALLQLADDCLYSAKRQGRDRVVAARLKPETSLQPLA